MTFVTTQDPLRRTDNEETQLHIKKLADSAVRRRRLVRHTLEFAAALEGRTPLPASGIISEPPASPGDGLKQLASIAHLIEECIVTTWCEGQRRERWLQRSG